MGLRARLAAALELPSDALGGMETVVHGREEVAVDHCRKILGYSTEEIYVKLADGTLRIVGEKLSIMRYFNGEMTVRGQIAQLVFREKTEGGATL